MDKFYVTFTLASKPLHCTYRARDMAHALQRLTDFIAGYDWERGTKSSLSIESISLTAKRGVTYEEGWL